MYSHHFNGPSSLELHGLIQIVVLCYCFCNFPVVFRDSNQSFPPGKANSSCDINLCAIWTIGRVSDGA